MLTISSSCAGRIYHQSSLVWRSFSHFTDSLVFEREGHSESAIFSFELQARQIGSSSSPILVKCWKWSVDICNGMWWSSYYSEVIFWKLEVSFGNAFVGPFELACEHLLELSYLSLCFARWNTCISWARYFKNIFVHTLYVPVLAAPSSLALEL